MQKQLFLINFVKKSLKLFKLILMVRFINILEQIWPVEEAATFRSVPMREVKDAQKINKDCH